MTPAVLEQAAKKMWGDDWKFQLAVKMKTTPSTVNTWFRTDRVPGLVAAHMEALMLIRALEIEIEKIRQKLGGLV